MKKLLKLLVCYSCLNSAFSHGMREDPYQQIFSPETSEAWKELAPLRTKLSNSESTNVNVAQALHELQIRDEDDKIAKYLIENFFLTRGNPEFSACWTKCYNAWKKAKDIIAALAIDVERIDCDEERMAYQVAASNVVINRISEIYNNLFNKYDKVPIASAGAKYSTGHFKENHDQDQSATRRLYDSIDVVMSTMRASNYTYKPVCSDVYFFISATQDDIKIGEALYWQREAELLLFDAQVALLMENEVSSVDTIKEALELRRKSLLPPNKDGISFKKILEDSRMLDSANKLLAERVSLCSLNATDTATAIANRCENLVRIDCMKTDQKKTMLQRDINVFPEMLAQKHIIRFLTQTTNPRITSSMVKELKSDFAAFRKIIISYVKYSANVEDVIEKLTDVYQMIDGMRISKYVNILKDIPPEVMIKLMHIKPEQLTQLRVVSGNTQVKMVDFIPDSMMWFKHLANQDYLVNLNTIISEESMTHLEKITPEILEQLQEMPDFMRELFVKTPIEFAEIFDHEIDCIDYIIRPLIKHANSIFQKDGDIKTYTEGWVQYILDVLKNFKKTELTYGVPSALSLASEIVMYNRLSGAFNGSYTPENVLDCFSNLINSSIQKIAIANIMSEMLGAFRTTRAKLASEFLGGYYKEEFREDLEPILLKSLEIQNKTLYDKYVKELSTATKTYLLNNTAKLIEISQRLYGNASYAVQLISMISESDDPYKAAYGAFDDNIEYLLEESILKDYIGRIRIIRIKDSVLYL